MIDLVSPAVQNIPAKLAFALVEAQAAIEAVSKDAHNKHQDYKYASADAVIGEAKAAMAKARMACIVDRWDLLPAGGERPHAEVAVHFVVLHESGEMLPGHTTAPVIPGNGRPIDKALAAALTTCQAYFLRSLLNIPRVAADDDISGRNDADHREETRPRGQSSNDRQERPRQERQERPREAKPATDPKATQEKPREAQGEAKTTEAEGSVAPADSAPSADAGTFADPRLVIANLCSERKVPLSAVVAYLQENMAGRKLNQLTKEEVDRVTDFVKNHGGEKAAN